MCASSQSEYDSPVCSVYYYRPLGWGLSSGGDFILQEYMVEVMNEMVYK